VLCLLATKSVQAAEYFVATNGNDSNAGTSWSSPLLTISNALNKVDVTIVTVSNGTYNVTAPLNVGTQLNLIAGITLRSFGNNVYGGLTNANNTIIDAGNVFGRVVMLLNHTNAVIDGLTFTRGKGISGAGVRMLKGTIQNCRITSNRLEGTRFGALFMAGGLVSNCHIVANSVDYQYYGVGVYLVGGTLKQSNKSNNTADREQYAGGGIGIYAENTGALVDSCVITNNRVIAFSSAGYGGGGGIRLVVGAKIRNSLIAGNVSHQTGGGVYCSGSEQGFVENCTIVGNYSTNGVGGVYGGTGLKLTNSIAYTNFGPNGVVSNWIGCQMSYSCTTPTNGLTGVGNTQSDPLLDAGYTLQSGSPCINTGTNQSWMIGYTDLAGNTRIQGGIVDMGCYEWSALVATTPPWSLYRPNLIHRRNLGMRNQESPQ
jgi:hypothetical protein